MDIRDIPLDILLHILAHLPLATIFVLRRTCKHFDSVTRLPSLWSLLFRSHVLDQHIPFPHTDLDDLEALTRRALTLRQTWTSPSPVPRRQLTLTASARVIFLQFLPGRSNRWLISVCMSVHPRSYLLQCWDVATEHPACVAELTHTDGPYGGVVLNSDPSSPAVLAMQSAQTETFSIRFDCDDPESAFETEATIDGIRELHLLSGSTLITRQTDDDGALSLWDLSDLRQEKLFLLNPSLIQPDDRIQAIHIAHDYALVLRIQAIELYSTIPRPNILPAPGAPIAYPLAQFKFQWRTDTVLLAEQHTSVSLGPIHLFVRFGSIYPWPVNVLHHYVLRPNPSWTHAHSPITTEYNLPYDLRPHAIHTIGSPVRLFGQATMALGRYGTALWLDNHTEEWLGPSDRGQRLAGRILHGTTEGTSSGTPSPEPSSPPGTEPTPNTNWSNATTVFGVRDDDMWTRIAMEEEAGRIALGHTDGTITLLEY